MKFSRALVWLLSFLGCMSLSALGETQRMVFAHYMLTNQDYQGDDGSSGAQELKILAYEREIREAQAAGVDGFALNAGGWLKETYYIRYAAQMFEAAVRLRTGFKLLFSADMCCGNAAEDVEDMMRRFAGNPRYAPVYFQYHDRFVLTTFGGDKLGVKFWQQLRYDLETGEHPSVSIEPKVLPFASGAPMRGPIPIFLVPALFWDGELPRGRGLAANETDWQTTLDGAFYWGIAGVPGSGGEMDQLKSSEAYAASLRDTGKLYMAPVAPGFWGANANRYYDYSGYEGFRAMWKQAAEVTKPPWVEIITWNDFIEGTNVSPIDDPNRYPNANFLTSSGMAVGTRGYFHTHAGFTALLPWFIAWYKTGSEPAVVEDTVALAYRSVLLVGAKSPRVGHIYGPLESSLYVTANLKGAARLVIRVGRARKGFELEKGSHDLRVPLVAGEAPVIELRRKGELVCTVKGKDSIVRNAPSNNLYLSTAACSSK